MRHLLSATKFLALAGLLLLGSCSVFDPVLGIFSDDDDVEQPAELVDVDNTVQLRRVWSTSIGSGQGDKFNRLKPAMANGRIFAASNNGRVEALSVENGNRLWRARLDYTITGGVTAANGMVLMGTENSQVIALSAEDGSILWVSEVTSEVLSAPVTNGRVVVALSVDGNLSGLDATTGAPLWLYENNVPDLSLRGDSSPLIQGNFVIAALANGSVISVALDNGTLRWEERVAIPTGRSEIDRMVDIDGDLVVNEAGLLLVPTYQGYLAAIDPTTGQTRWRVEESSPVSASFGFGNVYVVGNRDTVKAYRVNQQNTVWTNDQLSLRRLSSPLGFNNYVAVGDFEGYVHLLAQSDGRYVTRAKVDGDGINARMLSQGNMLFVYGNSGNLVALRVQ
jgi:outer membrane protein assembly factor BamB